MTWRLFVLAVRSVRACRGQAWENSRRLPLGEILKPGETPEVNNNQSDQVEVLPTGSISVNARIGSERDQL